MEREKKSFFVSSSFSPRILRMLLIPTWSNLAATVGKGKFPSKDPSKFDEGARQKEGEGGKSVLRLCWQAKVP